MTDEMIDLVNEHDEIIQVKPRSEIIEKKLTNFRLVSVFIIRRDGRILVPRRSATKKLYPNALGLIGGFVQSGETYEQALKREVLEETGIIFDNSQCTLLGKANPWDHGTMGYTAVYQIKTDKEVTFLSSEFSELFWLTPKEISKKIKEGEKITHNLAILLSLFYSSLPE